VLTLNHCQWVDLRGVKVAPVIIIGATGTISKMIHKILEQRTGKARYQGTAENSRTGHSTHTAGSANVEAQMSLILQTALYAPFTVRAG
jgi:predicted amino acid dehydrogenase